MTAEIDVVKTARGWLGTPYLHQSSVKQVGCDCLGLVVGVYQELFDNPKIKLPPYTANWRDRAYEAELMAIAEDHLSEDTQICMEPGRIALFQMARGYPLKHCGIITSRDQFIHAQERIGVAEVPLSDWWHKRVRKTFYFQERP